jgi:hypothetical protein
MLMKLQVYNFEKARYEFIDSYYPDNVLVNEAARKIMEARLKEKNWRI